jgi:hypothetical protein
LFCNEHKLIGLSENQLPSLLISKLLCEKEVKMKRNENHIIDR